MINHHYASGTRADKIADKVISSLKQDGWSIEYQNYSEQNGVFLPSKILLRSEKVYLKLLVEKWDNLSQP